MTDTELNDRLLGLKGECRHEWEAVYRVDTYGTLTVERLVCAKCGRDHLSNDSSPPAVGDGHQMTVEEMLDLVGQLCPDPLYVRFALESGLWQVDIYVDNAKPVVDVWGPELPDKAAALAAAIVAAVDGEPK